MLRGISVWEMSNSLWITKNLVSHSSHIKREVNKYNSLKRDVEKWKMKIMSLIDMMDFW